MARNSLRVEGASDAARSIRDMATRASQPMSASERWHDWVCSRYKRTFETSGRSEGFNWPNYTGEQRWLSLRERLGLRSPPLRWLPGRKERLAPSFFDKNHPFHTFRRSGKQIVVGSKLPYAITHQRGGGKNPFGETIPRRQIAGMGPNSRETMSRVVAAFVVDKRRKKNPFEGER